MSGYFVNENREYVFYLTQMSGKERAKKIGNRLELYKNKDLATKWYNDILKKLDLENNQDEDTLDAEAILNLFYASMIGEDDEEE